MPANVSTQFFETGNVSFKATAAVTGKRFLDISASATGGPGLSTDNQNLYQCAHAAAGVRAVGVSKYDVASGQVGGMHGQPGMIVPVTAEAAIAFGALVQVGTAGQAVTVTTGVAVGKAMTAATAGGDAQIKLL